MGDPKQTRKSFEKPPHPWQRTRIEEEKQIVKEYGLKNKKEVWKMKSVAKGFADQAKRLTASDDKQAKKEEVQMLERVFKLGLLPRGSTIDDVLGVAVKDILERRLQTVVFKKGLARSIKQARQFIIHRHIMVNNRLITSPSYLVPAGDEAGVSFLQKSALADEEHPERAIEEKKPKRKAPKAEEKKAGAKEEKPVKKKAEKKEKPKEEKSKEEKKE
ncbi:30S ribosomal protein S4 [Candidatus Woesearchaeota archaeon]|nr:30S ribosomal protein S4 [Candidatus Woesearchaeota archaeon]